MKRFKIGTFALIFSLMAVLYLATDTFSATPRLVTTYGTVVPLYDSTTVLDPETILNTPTALITNIGDRVRDRHAREFMFQAYDHWLSLYFIDRTVTIQVVDTIAKGGTTITYNMTSLFPLNKPNLRAFFVGVTTVAEYSDNLISTQVDPYHYTVTLKTNTNLKRPIKIGDRIEVEFSPFLLPPTTGRTNYYGTATLYVVGTPGMQAWEWHTPIATADVSRGATMDSYPLPTSALLGGGTSLSQNYSNEPLWRFQQIATNISPTNIQTFMLGRRLHHTDFGTGVHSESGNPIFTEQIGKLGPGFTNRSCIACHVHNGRSLPTTVNGTMFKYAIHVGSDATGTPDPTLGSTLQLQTTTGKAEDAVTISSFTSTAGTYGDGTAYSLQKPVYKFTGVVPAFYSVRLAPQLVGMGLLEAVDENTVAAFAAANAAGTDSIKGHMQVVTDPVTGQLRMGRFGYKADEASVKQQIASALNNDIGVTTSIYPVLDHGSSQPAPAPTVELADSDLANMNRYISTLGMPARGYDYADYAAAPVVAGQALFASASCIRCHVDTIQTSTHHPLTELRNQTIHPYTDLLLHDMGTGLADNMGQDHATGSERRTAPLWGIGKTAGVTGGEAYLHDGRARNLNEAILWHGGEAQNSREAFRNMSATDRANLIAFLKSL